MQATYSTSYPLPDIFPLTLLPAVDLSWPISLKIDAYTLIKIVLKIVIFKMVVKFIATICLLLFLPKLLHKKHDNEDDEESRGFISNCKLFLYIKQNIFNHEFHYANSIIIFILFFISHLIISVIFSLLRQVNMKCFPERTNFC